LEQAKAALGSLLMRGLHLVRDFFVARMKLKERPKNHPFFMRTVGLGRVLKKAHQTSAVCICTRRSWPAQRLLQAEWAWQQASFSTKFGTRKQAAV
jgi:hypothetical protein